MSASHPRLLVTFKRFGPAEYVVLLWGHDHKAPALSLECSLPLDDARRARIVAAVDALLAEVGDSRK